MDSDRRGHCRHRRIEGQVGCGVRPSDERFVAKRSEGGLEELNNRLGELVAAIVGLQAAGGYETVVAASLSAGGLPVVVVNPAQVRAFANALGRRAKTDPIDADVIGHFVEATKPNVRPLPDEATRQLSDLVGRRSQIVAMIVAEQQRKKHRPDKRMPASIERLLAARQRELSYLDGQVREAIKASPVWREKDHLLESVPGVGRASPAGCWRGCRSSARSTAARSPRSAAWRRDASVRPMDGQKLHRRRTRQRTQRPFHGSLGGGPPQPHTLKAFYERLLAAGKEKMVALIAVARKLLITLNAILGDGQPWREEPKAHA